MKIKRTNKLKTNTSGFGHIEMLLLVVAVVVIGGVGFFVYQNQNKKTASKATAHAGGYTQLSGAWNTNKITVSACKTYTNIWGGIYSVKVLFTKAASTPAYTYIAYDYNITVSQNTTSNAYYAGTVAAVTINMSVVNKDMLLAQTNEGKNSYQYFIYPGNGNASPNVKGINQITTC